MWNYILRKIGLSQDKTREPLTCSLKQLLGFNPRNLSYYEVALRHSSASLEGKDGRRINNERLEFLGDSVLSTAMSAYLYRTYKNWDEGKMSQRRGALVKRTVNNNVAIALGINKILIIAVPEKRLGMDTWGNALEALIGAIFLDRGYVYAERFVLKRFIPIFRNLEKELTDETTNYKSMLIEWAQKHHYDLKFETLKEPAHPGGEFICEIIVNGNRVSKGAGLSKKEAHQDAAHHAIKVIDPIKEK